MSVKQKRFSQDQFSTASAELLGEKCTIVFKNGSTLFLQLIKFEADQLKAIDMFTKKRTFPLSSIDEIIKEIRN